jgi:hypothetical protein
VKPIIHSNVARESGIMTDEFSIYGEIGKAFASHDSVKHSEDEYVRYEKDKIISTNTVEGYYSIFKRGMKGIYQHCKEKHLHRYLAEFDFRYSNRIRLGIDDVDVYQAAFRQLCRVEGRNIEDPLEAEFATVMRALEEALTEESGRIKRLSRTRQKLNRVGVRQTLADLALKPQPSLGFMKLLEFNMADMSAEALIPQTPQRIRRGGRGGGRTSPR